ncbi:MAG TPA: NAD(P)H-binding protein, partial [Myxococcota bacterium]|nr:NAD(P)H-binding protein [Myxococcota bacterium]
MSRIVIFGAGGRAGRHLVAEALRRGHGVTGVVRDPARHRGVQGDVTDVASVASTAQGHDVAICTVYQQETDHTAFYLSVAKALVEGLRQANVKRLIVIGMDTSLDHPFAQARAAELAYLQANAGGLDWHFLVPPPVVLT